MSSPKREQELTAGDDEDYDPHLHRNVEKPCTNFETYIHLFKCVMGTGILAMPQAFYNAGCVVGFIGTILIGGLCVYCLNQLVNNQYVICKQKKIPILTYPETVAIACREGPHFLRPFEKCLIYFVDVLLVIYQLGICCVYIVFVAGAIQSVCKQHVDWTIHIYMLIILLPLILMNCIRNLKLLAPFSSVANVLTLIGIGIVMYYLSTDIPEQLDVKMVGNPAKFPLFFGTTLFALNSVGVILALENNMATPKSFGGCCGVLNIGMTAISVVYALVGLLGYIRYGSECESSITYNLPETALAKSVNVMYALAVFISYGLQCYVPVQILWSTYIVKKLEGSKHLLLWEYALRIAIVIGTFALAISIPLLGLFISLFGAFCLSLLGISFPALIEICVIHPDYGYLKWKLVKNVILFFIGIAGLFIGTITTIIAIVESLAGESE